MKSSKGNKQQLKALTRSLLSEGKSIRTLATGYSMYPLIRPGTVIIIEALSDPGQLKPGDIIAWYRDEDLVAHRLVHRYENNGEYWFVTRGDSALLADDPVPFSQLAGRIVASERCGKSKSLKKAALVPEWKYRRNHVFSRMASLLQRLHRRIRS